ncbi:MAG: UDP-2,3-diacylglucosamine diphosphatase [Bacteroidales bacterium]|nr:UDP-2,3-diacylglucosamine diphosphatase [Candidatus Liminaster caballi]
MSKVYFISDLHLGAITFDNPLDYERRVCRFLDSIKNDCSELYLLGDIIDYWFEYKRVVPKGFTRFLGKLGEFTDAGIKVHWFTGNHDIWIFGYIQEETGAEVHTEGGMFDIQGRACYLAHGDGIGHDSPAYKFMTGFFHSRVCQRLFSLIHPDWATSLALRWSRHSRLAGRDMPDFLGEDKEHLVIFAKQYLKDHKDEEAPDFFIFGHRHIMLDMMLSRKSRIMILGDWITHFSYAVMDEGNLSLEQFEVDDSMYETEERTGVSIAF